MINLEQKLLEKVNEKIQHIIDEDINTNNLEHLYKLSKIKHMMKEDESMNYGNYSGRGPSGGAYGENYGRGGYGEYGEGSYGRRGRDRRYRGDEYMERMQGEYGRYEEGRRNYREGGSYGAKEDSMKSLRYMLEATVDFFKMLNAEAEGQEEKQLIRQYAQQISQM